MATTAKSSRKVRRERPSFSRYEDKWLQQRKSPKSSKPKFKVRLRNRCKRCGRPRGFLRKFRCAASASASWRSG